MSSTITATLTSNLQANETFSGGLPGNNTVPFAPLNESVTLNATTSPAATKHTPFSQPLTSGSATVDLTNLPGCTADEVVNGTGLKVQLIKLQNPATNANAITVAQGGSNAYGLLGSTFSITLQPGQSVAINGDGATPTVGSGAKNLALTGTGAQALNIHVVFG